MRKCILCLTLMLCLMLTACGSSEETPPQGQVSLSADSAELGENKILLTINGREVPAWRYFYWLCRACESICTEYTAAGIEVDWEAETGAGTLAEYVKAQALADTALYATVENWGQTYGCTISQKQVTVTAEKGLSVEQTAELEQVGQLYNELYTLFCTEGSDLAPEKAEVTAFAAENGWVGMERILVPFGDDKEAARTRAAEIFSRLNAAADPAAEFSVLAETNRDPAGIRTVHLGEDMISETLEDALASLEEGQFSGILETEDGYSILCRVPPDEEIVKERYFDHLLMDAALGADIWCAGEYKTLDVAAFWETQ